MQKYMNVTSAVIGTSELEYISKILSTHYAINICSSVSATCA